MSALRRLFATEGRGTLTLSVWFAESLLAWVFAFALGSVLAEPLRHRPEGVFALYAEGGRILLDYARTQEPTLRLAGMVTAGLVALWALAGTLLGGVIPFAAAPRLAVPTVSRAWAESLRRAPALLALGALALAGYGLVGLFGWYAWSFVDRSAARLVDVRAIDLRHAGVLAAALALAGLVRGWHAVARFQCLGQNLGALRAAGEAALRLGREPWRTLGRGLAWALLAGLGTALAFAVGLALERNPAGWAVATLTAVQQLSLLARVHCRARWYLGLGEPNAGT